MRTIGSIVIALIVLLILWRMRGTLPRLVVIGFTGYMLYQGRSSGYDWQFYVLFGYIGFLFLIGLVVYWFNPNVLEESSDEENKLRLGDVAINGAVALLLLIYVGYGRVTTYLDPRYALRIYGLAIEGEEAGFTESTSWAIVINGYSSSLILIIVLVALFILCSINLEVSKSCLVRFSALVGFGVIGFLLLVQFGAIGKGMADRYGNTSKPTSSVTRYPAAIDQANARMILVPYGSFTMGAGLNDVITYCQEQLSGVGCERSWFRDVDPVHPVTLNSFYIDQTEVTNEAFAAFLSDQGNLPHHYAVTIQTPDRFKWIDPPAFYLYDDDEASSHIAKLGDHWIADYAYANHPVTQVNWFGADAYCRWRGARLPTEAEWEKAARGSDERLFPWGNVFDDRRLNFCDGHCDTGRGEQSYADGFAQTSPVGAFPQGASPYGVLDMAGNVWEWVVDIYDADYYAVSPTFNPAGPRHGYHQVLRGGSFRSGPSNSVTVARAVDTATKNHTTFGFRCAQDAGVLHPFPIENR